MRFVLYFTLVVLRLVFIIDSIDSNASNSKMRNGVGVLADSDSYVSKNIIINKILALIEPTKPDRTDSGTQSGREFDCPVESRKVVHKIDAYYACLSGGNFECDEVCQSRFDDDDEEVLGGRCLSAGGLPFRFEYDVGGGYMGYGGSCVCFYCKGMGVSDTMVDGGTKIKTLVDDEFGHPLCNVQSMFFDCMKNTTRAEPPTLGNIFRINVDVPLVITQSAVNVVMISVCHCISMPKEAFARVAIVTNTIVRVKRVAMLNYSELVIVELWEQVLKKSRQMAAITANHYLADCRDMNPNEITSVEVFAPVPRSTSVRLCQLNEVVDTERVLLRHGMKPIGFMTPECTKACLKSFMHNPVGRSSCVADPRNDGITIFDHRCVCYLCIFPACLCDTWNNWSYCSSRCGGGTRRRKRNVITGDKNACTESIQYRSCNQYPCPVDCVVAPWMQWGYCHGYCGAGSQSRDRQMLVPCGTSNYIFKPLFLVTV